MTEDNDPGNSAAAKRFGLKGLAQPILIGVAVVVAIYLARAPVSVSVDDDEVASVTPSRPTVNVIHPLATRAAREVRTTGVVSVRGGVALRAQAVGEVVFVSPALRSGGSFAAGQTLLRIDSRAHAIRLDAAKAAQREAEARLLKQQLKGEAGRRRFQRDNPGTEVPDIVARIPQIARAQARVDRALHAVQAAELDLSHTMLALPFDGWVRNGVVQVGQIVGPATPVGQVFAKDALQVEAQISQLDLEALAPIVGHAATVWVRETHAFDVVVERVSAVVDLQSRLATLYLVFPDDADFEALPRPGTFVKILLEGQPMDGVMVLPEAVEQSGGSIWRVEEGALQSFQPRALGRNRAGWLVEAFDPKQGVVIGRVAQPRSGMLVAAVAATDSRP